MLAQRVIIIIIVFVSGKNQNLEIMNEEFVRKQC